MGKFIEQACLTENMGLNGKVPAPQTVAKYVNRWDERKFSGQPLRKLPLEKRPENFLLAALSDKVLNRLLPYLEKVSFSGGESIYQPGDSVNYIYFPETVVMSEFQILKDGRMVEIAMTGREGMIGLLPAFDAQPATNWVQVSIAGSAFKIKSAILRKEIFELQPFQPILLDCINNYVRQVSQRAVCNSYHTLEERFCSWILMLQARRRSNKLSLTQEQIARFLGSHRPSVTHIAQSLRAKKIIDYVRGKLLILNRREMEKTACDCYSEIDNNFINVSKIDRVH